MARRGWIGVGDQKPASNQNGITQARVREATPSWAVCLMAELWEEDVSAFRKFVRMDPEMFRELLLKLGPRLNKDDTGYRKALDPNLKLTITLRYLATGDS